MAMICYFLVQLSLALHDNRLSYALNQATGYTSQHIWCLSQARINWKGCIRKGIWHQNGGMVEVGAPISLDGVAVHLDCWCICPCYLHFAPENPEDGEMYLLYVPSPGLSQTRSREP